MGHLGPGWCAERLPGKVLRTSAVRSGRCPGSSDHRPPLIVHTNDGPASRCVELGFRRLFLARRAQRVGGIDPARGRRERLASKSPAAWRRNAQTFARVRSLGARRPPRAVGLR